MFLALSVVLIEVELPVVSVLKIIHYHLIPTNVFTLINVKLGYAL